LEIKTYSTVRNRHNQQPLTRVTGQLADCQLADWTTRGCHRRLCMLSFRSFGGICETASCPVRDLSSPRVGNPRVVQLPLQAFTL